MVLATSEYTIKNEILIFLICGIASISVSRIKFSHLFNTVISNSKIGRIENVRGRCQVLFSLFGLLPSMKVEDNNELVIEFNKA
jgi:hypothetical protein